MAREVTQRQRAEAVYGSLTCTTYREGYQDPDNDIGIIEQALTTARQEALKEARLAVAGEMCDEPDHACGSLQRILDDIDRLAREGVK